MGKLSPYGWLLTFLVAIVTAVANILLRKGIDHAGGFTFTNLSTLFFNFAKLLAQPIFIIGFICYFAAALIWFRVIASEPLSVAYPILVSITFILVSYAATIYLQEPMTLRSLGGILLVSAGITLISWG